MGGKRGHESVECRESIFHKFLTLSMADYDVVQNPTHQRTPLVI